MLSQSERFNSSARAKDIILCRIEKPGYGNSENVSGKGGCPGLGEWIKIVSGASITGNQFDKHGSDTS
jgi:hypothetical protein